MYRHVCGVWCVRVCGLPAAASLSTLPQNLSLGPTRDLAVQALNVGYLVQRCVSSPPKLLQTANPFLLTVQGWLTKDRMVAPGKLSSDVQVTMW